MCWWPAVRKIASDKCRPDPLISVKTLQMSHRRSRFSNAASVLVGRFHDYPGERQFLSRVDLERLALPTVKAHLWDASTRRRALSGHAPPPAKTNAAPPSELDPRGGHAGRNLHDRQQASAPPSDEIGKASPPGSEGCRSVGIVVRLAPGPALWWNSRCVAAKHFEAVRSHGTNASRHRIYGRTRRLSSGLWYRTLI